VDATFSMDDLHDAARLARDCPVMGHAVALARWIGEGHRPVTAGQVLRKADLPAAGAVLGVDVPGGDRIRRRGPGAGRRSRRRKITYTYDLGTEWRHEITVEKTLVRDPGQDYPLCVAFRGDSPVEYWSEEDPSEPEPFDLADVNRKLAELAEQASPS
jgi:hypothetical protein